MFKRLYRKYFKPSHSEKLSDTVFVTRISLSVLAMIVCCVIFCSATFALFNCRESTTVSPVKTAEYKLKVTCNEAEPIPTDIYTCPQKEGNEHILTFTPCGTATIGYCIIKAGEKTYTTAAIARDESFTLTVIAGEGTVLTFCAAWGDAPAGTERLQNGSTLILSSADEITSTETTTEATAASPVEPATATG